MENILEVVAERDNALSVLETGRPAQPEAVQVLNDIGMWTERFKKEHFIPKHINSEAQENPEIRKPWVNEYVRLYNEAKRKKYHYAMLKQKEHKKKLQEIFPKAEIE